jgi:WD40 repeat protein
MKTQVFEGHSHYVMQVALNPKDPSTFATASLDRTVKVWSLGQVRKKRKGGTERRREKKSRDRR